MKLSSQDVAKLQEKELANCIRKLSAGKTLTRDERRLLESAPGGGEGNYAATWDELARALGITRRGLQKARERFPDGQPLDRADGRKSIADWRAWCDAHEVRGRGAGEQDGEEDPDANDPLEKKSESYFRKALLVEKIERVKTENAMAAGQLLEAPELEVALGQAFIGIQTALILMPASAARSLVGIRDIREVQNRLQGEIDAVLNGLNMAIFLDDVLKEAATALAVDPADLQRITTLAREALAAIGRRALGQLTESKKDAEIADVVTGQVSDEAEAREGVRQAGSLVAAPGHAPAPPRPPSPAPRVSRPAKGARKQKTTSPKRAAVRGKSRGSVVPPRRKVAKAKRRSKA